MQFLSLFLFLITFIIIITMITIIIRAVRIILIIDDDENAHDDAYRAWQAWALPDLSGMK